MRAVAGLLVGTHCSGLRVIKFRKILDMQKSTTYCYKMPRMSSIMLAIFCTSLLGMQFSGLHLHVNPEGSGGLHGTHIHGADPDGHDHEADTDVSPFELGTGWTKLLSFLIPFVFIMLAAVQPGKLVWKPITRCLHSRGFSRWRPPLRAPPITVS